MYSFCSYLRIVDHLNTLQAQLQQCKSDIESLQDLKQTAFAEPESFIEFLKSEASRSAFPTMQKIQRIPDVSLAPYRQKLTRRSNPKFEQNLEYLSARVVLANRQRQHLMTISTPTLQAEAEPKNPPVPPTKRFFPEIRREFLKVLDHPVPESLINPSQPTAVHQPRPRRFTPMSSAAEPFSEIGRPASSVPLFAPTPVSSKKPTTPKAVAAAAATSYSSSSVSVSKQRMRKISAHAPENTSLTHNIPWSDDEKRKLEYLLTVYPEEEVQARRYAKVAAALGTRTANQVASRVQKLQAKAQRKASHSQIADEETRELVSQLEAYFAASSDPQIKSTPEYAEYLRLKNQLEAIAKDPLKGVLHTGYSCDRCGADPIIGARWTCSSCPKGAPSIDLCDMCISSGFETAIHKNFHIFKKNELPEEMTNDTADADFLFK